MGWSHEELEAIKAILDVKELEPSRYGWVEYENGDSYELIKIGIWKDDNQARYELEMSYADRDEEIATPESMHDNVLVDWDEWERELKEELGLGPDADWDLVIKAWSKRIDKEIEAWEGDLTIKVTSAYTTIELSRAVIKETCYLNVTHEHLYKGAIIKAETWDFEELLAILRLKELLAKIAMSIR